MQTRQVWIGSSIQSSLAFLSLSLPLVLLLSRCMSLSDPAAIPDTPRGRGPQPPQKEETAEQEEPLSLFDLPAAPQTVRGGPDRHPGQCRLRRPQLRDSSLTPRLNHQAIGPLNLTPPRPHTQPTPPPSASKREAWPWPFAAPDIELLRRFSSKSVGVFRGGVGLISPKTRTMAFFSKLLVSRGISLEKCSEKYIMYINSKKKQNKNNVTNKGNSASSFSNNRVLLGCVTTHCRFFIWFFLFFSFFLIHSPIIAVFISSLVFQWYSLLWKPGASSARERARLSYNTRSCQYLNTGFSPQNIPQSKTQTCCNFCGTTVRTWPFYTWGIRFKRFLSTRDAHATNG